MRNLIIIFLITFIPAFTSAQSRKEIKAAGIKAITEYKTEYKSGVEKKIRQSETKYDAEGNDTELIEYDDFGKITKHEKYTYNTENDKASVAEYDAAGKLKKTTKFTYNENGDKLTVAEYDGAGKLKKTTKYTYFSKFKTGKEVYDASNKLVSKKTYDYTR
jgi:hypothetical protein